MITKSKSQTFLLKKQLASAKQLLTWNRKLFWMFGLDPLGLNNWVFSIAAIYITAHLVMTLIYIPTSFQYTNQTIDCVCEVISEMTMLFKLLMYRHKAPLLEQMLKELEVHFSMDKYRSNHEAMIFYNYMSICKKVFKMSLIAGYISGYIYYGRFLLIDGMHIPKQTDSNNVTVFLTPYRMKFFYPLTNLTLYSIAMVYVLPIIVFATFFMISDGNMLILLVAHACSQLSILSQHCLQLLGDDPVNFKTYVTDAIRRNYYVMKFVADINLAFSILMLQQRVGAVFSLCLFSYAVLANWRQDARIAMLFNMFIVLCVIFSIFVYSYLGQCLIDESSHLNEALCRSSWYNLKKQDLKYYLILHIHLQKPLYIDCGGFFLFSLDSFITIAKSAMAYLSVLNAMT